MMKNGRNALLCTAAVSLALLSHGPSARAADTLAIAAYGGLSGDILDQCAFKPFTAETGVQITVEQGASLVTLQKLQQQKDNPQFDIAFMDSGISETAIDSDVVATLDPAKIPNMANLLPAGLPKTAAGDAYALVTGFYAVSLMYNTEEITTTPTSWKALWDPKYENLLSIPNPTNLLGVMMISMAGKIYGSGPEDYQTGIAELAKLKPAFFFDSIGTADSAFQAGEVVLGPNLVGTAINLAKQGMPLASSMPEEGVPAATNRVHLVKGGKQVPLAESFINYVAKRETLTCFAEKGFWGPAINKPELSAEAKANMPWGPTGSIDSLLVLDWNFVNKSRPAMIELWNKSVAAQ